MRAIKRSISSQTGRRWAAIACAVLALGWAGWQMAGYAHMQESVLDEGAYLYKGLLFARGDYAPYQPYGLRTNHMPLAFLIPGWFQAWLGPGLETGRYVAILWALLMMIGIWIIVRRFNGPWWAAAALVSVAANPFLLKTYSTGISQGLVACQLTWMLVFTLGEKRPTWQLLLGGLLSATVVLTRVNIAPAPALLVLYIFWQHGRKAGLLTLAAAGLALLAAHLIYWPDILQIWARLLPEIPGFLSQYLFPKEYRGLWKPDITFEGRLLSFFLSFRFIFVMMTGVLGTALLWPRRQAWDTPARRRAAMFLAALFVVLLLAHMYAALGNDYCVFCLAGYINFFTPVGLLLVFLTLPAWRVNQPAWLQALGVALLLVIAAGIGFSAFERFGETLANFSLPRWLLADFRPGSVTLQALVINKLGLDPDQGIPLMRRLAPAGFGLLVGLLLVGLSLLYGSFSLRAGRAARLPAGSFFLRTLHIFLIAGLLLSPTAALGGGYDYYDCSGDVPAAYRAAGEQIARQIPAGSQVYWRGTLSVAPLLYAPGIRIFPQQINQDYSFMVKGDDLDMLARLGYFNQALAEQYLEQADYVLIQQVYYKGWIRERMEQGGYIELPHTAPTAPCRDSSFIRIFQNQR